MSDDTTPSLPLNLPSVKAPRRIVVLGGSGFVGRSLCEHLVRRLGGQGTVVVPTRRLSHAQAVRHLPNVEVVQADVHQPAELAALLRGADAVVNLVAILHGSPQAFEQAHVRLPTTLVQAGRDAGVRRVLHISALGVPEGGQTAPSNYLRSKAAGEAVLMQSGLDVTLLRPSVIFGARDRFLNTFAQLLAAAPVVPLACADARFQPVWVEDVAAAAVACLWDGCTIGRIYDCAGPQEMTLGELVSLAGRLSGHPRPVLPLPLWAGRLQAAAMGLMPGEPLMTGDNLDSMSVPNVSDGRRPGLRELGIEPASVQAIAPTYLSPLRGCAALEPLRRRAGRR